MRLLGSGLLLIGVLGLTTHKRWRLGLLLTAFTDNSTVSRQNFAAGGSADAEALAPDRDRTTRFLGRALGGD